MPPGESGIPAIDDDPVIRRLWRGEARTLREAEEQYLNASLDEAIALLHTSLSDEELGSVVNNLANEPRPAKLGIAFSVLPGLRGR